MTKYSIHKTFFLCTISLIFSSLLQTCNSMKKIDLIDDLIPTICEFNGNQNDILNFRFINKKWKHKIDTIYSKHNHLTIKFTNEKGIFLKIKNFINEFIYNYSFSKVFTPKNFQAFCTITQNIDFFVHLDLSDTDVTNKHLLSLPDNFKNKVIKLTLHNCQSLNCQSLKSFDALTKFINLQHLDLSENRLGDKIEIITTTLKNLTKLQFLNLSNTVLGLYSALELHKVDGTNSFISVLKNLTQLQYLDLSKNYLYWNATPGTKTKIIALDSKKLTQLKHLNLSENRLGDKIEVITIPLKNLTKLQYLDLSNTGLGRAATNFLKIASALRNLTQLNFLNLSNNMLGQYRGVGVNPLASALKNLTQLQHLDLSKNYLGLGIKQNAEIISTIIENLSQTLLYLNLSENLLIALRLPQYKTLLISIPKKLRRLKHLDLTKNFLGECAEKTTDPSLLDPNLLIET